MPDHAERMERAQLALEGLSVGDSFGERFFHAHPADVLRMLAMRQAPPPPWRYTDDTAMALGLTEVLDRSGGVDQDLLSLIFARNYTREPNRGYGGGARRVLERVWRGTPWQIASRSAFRGAGSMGNGGAMRVAPLAGYFADDPDRLVQEARRSAEVTHAHPEGQAGAIAAAVAGSAAWRMGPEAGFEPFLRDVLERTPPGLVRSGLERALDLGPEARFEQVVGLLGNGSEVTAQDTVPFAVWCAARNLGRFEDALWDVAAAGGDRDTLCAIVGGIVVLAVGRAGLPAEWLRHREPLPVPESV